MKTIHVMLIILMTMLSAQAQMADLNLARMRYGQETTIYSARMLGLAGSGLANKGSLANALQNPALVSAPAGRLTLQAGMMSDKLIEDRQFPYYDSFAGFNDFGSYSFNSNYYFAPYFMARYALPLEHSVAIQAGVMPFLDFRYNYAEEVRDPFDKTDKLLGYNWIEQTGLFRQIFVAIGAQVMGHLNVGLKVGLLTGQIDSTMKIQPRVPGDLFAAQRVDLARNLSNHPLLVNLGLHYAFNQRLALGAFVRLPYTLDFDKQLKQDSLQVKEQFTYPLIMGGGLDYRFQSILEARVFLDFIYRSYGSFKVSTRSKLNYRDVFTLRAGAEYFFFHDQLPFRIGFAYFTLPYNHNLANTLLSVGSGWYLKNWHIDLAAGLNHQEFYQPDLFPDTIYGLEARSDLDRVKWTNYFFRFDVTINLF